MRKTRIFFTTDLHGSEHCFKKFLNAARFYKVDVLIVGGDITGKMLVPILKNENGSISAQIMGRIRKAKNEKEIKELMTFISSMGFYPYITTPQEMKRLEDPQKLQELFRELVIDTLNKWIKLADERLKNSNVKCFIQLGNDDLPEAAEILEKSECIINPEDKVIWIDEYHEMISVGCANLTPWRCPRDLPEDELYRKIEKMASKVNDPENAIFNFHCPPYETELDLAPELDENLTVVIKGGKVNLIHVGSTAVRKAIERNQPLISLHGHIHESRGIYKIGRTLCFNPGSEYTEGILRGLIIQLKERGMAGYQFTSG